MPNTFLDPRPRFFDNNRVLLAGGRVKFLEAGSVDIDKAIYADDAHSVELANPVSIPSDGIMPLVFLGEGKYKVVVQKQVVFLAPPDDVWDDVWVADNLDGNYVTGSASTSTATVTNLAALKDLDPTTYPYALVLGHAAAGDGGGGVYAWQAGSTIPDDNGTVIQLSLGQPGRYFRNSPEQQLDMAIWNGANFSSACDSAWSAAAAYSATVKKPIYFGPGNFKFADSIILDGAFGIVVGEGASFQTISAHGVITFAVATSVETETQLCGRAGCVAFTAASKVPHWNLAWSMGGTYAANVQAFADANASELPLYVNGDLSVASGTNPALTVATHGIVVGMAGQFTMLATTAIRTPLITVTGSSRKFIYGDAGFFSQIYPTRMDAIEGWWFGVGLPGDNTDSLTYAMACAEAAQTYSQAVHSGVVLNVPALTSGTAWVTSMTVGYKCNLRFLGEFNATGGFGAINATCVNSPYDSLFRADSTVFFGNDVYYPRWFGAQPGSSSDFVTNYKAIAAACAHGSIVDGLGEDYYISDAVVASGPTGYQTIRNINLVAINAAATTNTMLLIDTLNCTVDNCHFDDTASSSGWVGLRFRGYIGGAVEPECVATNCRFDTTFGIYADDFSGQARTIKLMHNHVHAVKDSLIYAKKTLMVGNTFTQRNVSTFYYSTINLYQGSINCEGTVTGNVFRNFNLGLNNPYNVSVTANSFLSDQTNAQSHVKIDATAGGYVCNNVEITGNGFVGTGSAAAAQDIVEVGGNIAEVGHNAVVDSNTYNASFYVLRTTRPKFHVVLDMQTGGRSQGIVRDARGVVVLPNARIPKYASLAQGIPYTGSNNATVPVGATPCWAQVQLGTSLDAAAIYSAAYASVVGRFDATGWDGAVPIRQYNPGTGLEPILIPISIFTDFGP